MTERAKPKPNSQETRTFASVIFRRVPNPPGSVSPHDTVQDEQPGPMDFTTFIQRYWQDPTVRLPDSLDITNLRTGILRLLSARIYPQERDMGIFTIDQLVHVESGRIVRTSQKDTGTKPTLLLHSVQHVQRGKAPIDLVRKLHHDLRGNLLDTVSAAVTQEYLGILVVVNRNRTALLLHGATPAQISKVAMFLDTITAAVKGFPQMYKTFGQEKAIATLFEQFAEQQLRLLAATKGYHFYSESLGADKKPTDILTRRI